MTIQETELKYNLLCQHYAKISFIEEQFGRNSRHKAFVALDKYSREILNEIEELRIVLQNAGIIKSRFN